MNIKKKDLLEIIDSNGDLIGSNDIPTNGNNLESQASNTTDYNQKIGTQPYRYDMLGRLGFSGYAFMEGKEDQKQNELFNDLSELMHKRYLDILKYYHKNPNKLKPDYRKAIDDNKYSEECVKDNTKLANEIMKTIQSHFENVFKSEIIDETSSINEESVVEDKMIDKKCEDEISKRSEDKDVREKKIEKIAGLINKLDKKDVNNLINLLERK